MIVKWIKRIAIILILIPVAIITPFFVFPILNDIRADKLADEMLSAPAPERTEIIEVVSGCGNTSGTGNHTEIWIGLLIKSELKKEDLAGYYRNLYGYIDVFEPAVSYGDYPLVMYLVNVDFQSVKNISDLRGYYIVGRTEDAVSSDFDLRGH